MKKTSLFSKIWKKHFKTTPASKLVDDIGALQGVFSWKKYDSQGRLIEQSQKTNTLVNESKSTIIRLISQGQTPWVDASDTSNFKISKMRFSNAQHTGTHVDVSQAIYNLTAGKKLEYYDITQASSRLCEVQQKDLTTDLVIPGVYGAGGNLTAASIGAESTAKNILINKVNVQYNATGYEIIDNKKVFPVITQSRPPSPGTFKIEFYKKDTDENTNRLIETVYFYNPSALTADPYVRAGNYPVKIVNEDVSSFTGVPDAVANMNYRFVTTPSSARTGFVNNTTTGQLTTILGAGTTQTQLNFDYTLSALNWRLFLEESSFAKTWEAAVGNEGKTYWDSMKIIYDEGKFNVINTIVPVKGTNLGTGKTFTDRYGAGNIDYYSTLAPVYMDAATDYVDDYAVTFRVDMDHLSGNGNILTASGIADEYRLIQYRKAYLFTKNDKIFSVVSFDPFEKDQNSNYVLYWTIKAPIN